MKRMIALLMMVLVVACAKPAVVDSELPPAPAAPQPMPTPAEPVVEEKVVAPSPAPKVETKPAEPVQETMKNTPDVQAVLDKADEKVTSYEFYYAPPPDNLARNKYHVKDTKVKVELYEVNFYNPEDYFDTVYLDTVKKTAVAFCENRQTSLCGKSTQAQNLPYEEYAIKLPHEYLAEVSSATKIGSETLYDRMTVKLKYEVNGQAYETWVDQYSGLPLRIKVGLDKEAPKFEFREMGINSLDIEEVSPPAN